MPSELWLPEPRLLSYKVPLWVEQQRACSTVLVLQVWLYWRVRKLLAGRSDGGIGNRDEVREASHTTAKGEGIIEKMGFTAT